METTKANGGGGVYHPKLMQVHIANIWEDNIIALKETIDDMELEAMASSCEDYNMCMFIRNSDNGSYRSLKTTLDNNRLLKKYPYTKTL